MSRHATLDIFLLFMRNKFAYFHHFVIILLLACLLACKYDECEERESEMEKDNQDMKLNDSEENICVSKLHVSD